MSSSRSRLDDDVVIFDAHRERLGQIGSLDQFGTGLHRHGILPDAQAGRVAPGLAGADIELPAMPGAIHHFAAARSAVVTRLARLHEAGLDAEMEAAAPVRATIVERKELAAEVEHHDRTRAGGDQLSRPGR